ncbi:MAG: hypothetical protein JO264_06625 [Acidisphaera sp.]|nr:hypothetical protein [Acidisphaera sp.]
MWKWLFEDATIAGVTWVGTLLGGVGLYLTYMQARAAKSAAEAASEAVQSLQGRVNIGSIAYSYSQVELIRGLVQNGHLSPAQVVFHSLKRAVLEVCSSFSNEKELVDQISLIKRNIAAIEHHLDLGIQNDPKFNSRTVTKSLAGISTFLLAREHALKFRVLDEEKT